MREAVRTLLMVVEDLTALLLLVAGGALLVLTHSPSPEGGSAGFTGYVLGAGMIVSAAVLFAAARDARRSGSLNRKLQWAAVASLASVAGIAVALKLGAGA